MTIYYKTLEKKVSQGKITLGLIMIFSIIALGIIYLVETNSTIAATYQSNIFQKTLQQKQEANQELSLKLVRVQSLPYLRGMFNNLSMISVDKTEYLKSGDNQVAVK